MHFERKQSIFRERGILFGCLFPEDAKLGPEFLDELEDLATTAGVQVEGRIIQQRDKPDPAYVLGKGKAEELNEMARAKDVDMLICDSNLSPSQVKNLEKLTERKVIDRTELILDIFATRAQTIQAKLQVELAQLEYSLPRLKRMWTHLSRMKAGVGTRGPGEKQIEEDRQIVQRKIFELKKQLEEIGRRRERQALSRSGEYCASLVGYTNAGKSSLLRALTGADVLVEDKLFATLDTRTRVAELGEGRKILLSDTVGFVRKLPHNLVASFHSTLAETLHADLLLHVVDVSHPECENQISTVNEVLATIDGGNKPLMMVFNKVDKLEDHGFLRLLEKKFPRFAAISAKTGLGLDELRQSIRREMSAASRRVRVSTDAGNGRLLAFLAEHCDILSKEYTDSTAVILADLKPDLFGRVLSLGGKIEDA